ncbi:unnamed protein product [Rotaria sp. Silwood1]|nr:unnamed protein product [Rotaria sp. Silwood1]
MGSNFIGIEPLTQLSRWDKQNRQKVSVNAPQIVKTSKKWYMRIAWRILDLMVINAWVLWKHMLPDDQRSWRRSRLFYFKMDIANIMLRELRAIERRMLKVLVTNQSSSESDDDDNNLVRQKRKRETASNISSMVRFDGLEHWPQYQQSLRLRCKNKGCSMKINVYCSKCQVHLFFCTTRNCFKDYHCKN